MKKVLGIVIITALIMTSIGPISVNATENENYGWELIEVVDLDNKEDFRTYNENNKDYELEGSYGRNNFSIKWTYVGKTDTYPDPDMINGESITFDGSFSQPAEQIKPGDEIPISLSLSAGGNSLSFFSPFASVRAQIGKNSSGWSDFLNSDEKASFKTDSKNNYVTFSEDISATAPEGKEGDRLELRFHLYCKQKLETRYIYEYKKIDGTPSEVEEYTPPETEDISSTEDENDSEDTSQESGSKRSSYEVPKTPEGEYIDSGVRFQDAYGEVLIRRGDKPLEWEALQPDTIVYYGDLIRTSYDSQAKMSFSDLTSFTLSEESEIIIDKVEDQNKLSLLAGKIISNVKKMVKDGSMNIEMFQAVAGIKGTTFVLEENGKTSTLKVFEGTVEFTPYGKESIIVTGEETVSITDGIPSQVEKFSISEELSSWDKDTQEEYVKILEEKGITVEDTGSTIEENTTNEADNETIESEDSTIETEDIDYNFEEKIDEYEKHVQRQSIIKYLVAAIIIGGAVGGFFLYKKMKS